MNWIFSLTFGVLWLGFILALMAFTALRVSVPLKFVLLAIQATTALIQLRTILKMLKGA